MSLIQTGIEESGSLNPARFSVCPNPVKDEMTISYQLGKHDQVSCCIYDAAGNRIANLADGIQSAGAHSLRWDAGRLVPGIYFCELAAGSWSRTFRLAKVN